MENNTLRKPAFRPFTAKEIKPRGWMRRQLEIEARGLVGNLDKIWPDVADSAWIGGAHESWERVPYWLDGFIPLAYLLEDDDLIARAKKYIDAILERQRPDGWLCPCEDKKRGNYDTWALELISKVLVLWYDCSGDKRIPDVLYRTMKQFSRHVEINGLLHWGAARWFEILFALYRLYEWYPEEWILSLCDKTAAYGVDWKQVFRRWEYETPRFGNNPWGLLHHVVNQAMMLKSEALYSLRSGDDPTEFAEFAYGKLTAAHGQVYGTFSGDECLAGTSPVQGTELCAIVEEMFSFETLFAISGDPLYADRTEYLGFNALPATCSPDMWTHQYVQLANQVACRFLPTGHVHYTTNPADSNLFGLEPCYGCCTSNMGQGYPKLCLSAFYRAPDGIVSAVLVPSELKTKIGDTDVTVTLDTDYPFRDTLTYKVSVTAPVTFALSLRIPGFAHAAKVDGNEVPVGAFYKSEREWSGETTVSVSLDYEITRVPAYDGMSAVRRGPLLYSLPIDGEWHPLEYVRNGVTRKFPYCDYEVLPKSAWNYGFASDRFTVTERDTLNAPFLFSEAGAPVAIEADLAPVEWEEEYTRCAASPRSREALGKAERKLLLPYGCTTLRMTVLPDIVK